MEVYNLDTNINLNATILQEALEWVEDNQELTLKWVQALRSGDYKQARKILRSPHGGFCCLGVLHEVDGGHWDKTPSGFTAIVDSRIHKYNLPDDVMKARVQDLFTHLNDNFHASFEEIAEWVESRLINGEPPVGAEWYNA